MSLCLLYLICLPKLEDSLSEWLLERGDPPGFTSMPTAGHGSSEHSMTLAEQVAGRSRRVLFLLELSEERAQALIDDLSAAFGGSGIHYWLAPIHAAGRIE
jgi:hypothetical protein